MKISPFPIRIDRLLLSIRWLRWAGHHVNTYPWEYPSPDGFAGREVVQEIIKRYGISKASVSPVGWRRWNDAVTLLEANPDMFHQEIDISGLLAKELDWLRAAHTENRMDGLVRFLHAIACGELSEADLMNAS